MLYSNFHSVFNIISNDLAQPWAIGFQDGASPGFSGIIDLHNTIFFYLVVISIAVFWLLGSIIYFYNGKVTNIVHKYLNHGTLKCLPTLLLNNNINKQKEKIFLFNLKESIKTDNFKMTNIIFTRSFSTLVKDNKGGDETLLNKLDQDKGDLSLSSVETSMHPIESLDKEKLTPVKTYESTYLNRKEILEENKNKSGIYRFYNKLNGKFYIGSSKNLKNRFLKYFNLNNISALLFEACADKLKII